MCLLLRDGHFPSLAVGGLVVFNPVAMLCSEEHAGFIPLCFLIDDTYMLDIEADFFLCHLANCLCGRDHIVQ